MKSFFKSFKGKVAAIGIAIVVIWSGGAVFAGTSAGEQLRTWYNGMFGQSVAEIEAETESYIESRVPGLEAEYESLREQAGIDIDLSRELATGETLEEIIQAKLEHIGEIDAEQQAILAEIGLQYYNVYLDGYFEILRTQDEAFTYADNDLREFTENSGQYAIDQLTTDINEATDQAVQELEEAIQQAQQALAAEIDNQEKITTRNLRNQVDWTIEDLRNQVTDLLTDLVNQQQDLIVAAAQSLGDEAKATLDEVVSGINE